MMRGRRGLHVLPVRGIGHHKVSCGWEEGCIFGFCPSLDAFTKKKKKSSYSKTGHILVELLILQMSTDSFFLTPYNLV